MVKIIWQGTASNFRVFVSRTRSWGSSVIIETRLQAGWPEFNSQQGQWWNFSLHHCIQTGPGTNPVSYPMATGGSLSQEWSNWNMNLTTCLHLVPRLEMHGAIQSPITSSWCGA